MKHIISLLFFWLLAVELSAQLRVDGFELRPMDTSANAPGTRVEDGNGQNCALIKVIAPPVGLDKFFFSVGSFGVKAQVLRGNEIWVYVPREVEFMDISHEGFSGTRFEFPEHLQAGTTYRLLLNVGGGRFVNIFPQGAPGASIFVDGEHKGDSVRYNLFLPFGTHQLTARRGRMEGSTELTVGPGEGTLAAYVTLTDQSAHFGEVIFEVDDPNAVIYFQGQRKSAGSWRTELREGTYEVVTRKPDCDDGTTTFSVLPQQQRVVRANPPVPHTGTVRLYVRPRGTQVIYDNNRAFDATQPQVLPVGAHQFQFSRGSYVTRNQEIQVRRNTLTADTIELAPINFLKSRWAFYFGAGYTVQSLAGVTGYAGAVWSGVDVQLSYTLGLAATSDVYSYRMGSSGHELLSANTFKLNAMAVHLGWQLRLIPRLGITPQVGYLRQQLASTVSRGSGKYADGAAASCLTLGARIMAVPAHRVYLFAVPQYAVELSRDAGFEAVARAADIPAGGFAISAGVLINIGQ